MISIIVIMITIINIIIIIVIAMCSEENGIIKRSRGWEQTPRKLRWISYFSPTSPLFSRRACFLGQVPPFYKAATWGLPSRHPGGQVNHLICQLWWEEYRAGDTLTTFNLAQEETASFSPPCLHTWSNGGGRGVKKEIEANFLVCPSFGCAKELRDRNGN